MPRIFSFERELLATLDLMPLAVRRKLDLAGLKLSLEGWQALPIADRRALAGAEVDDEAGQVAFAGTLRAASERAGVALKPLPRPEAFPWRAPALPTAVRARLGELGVELGDAAWAGLDDEARFALLHLSDPRRELERLRAALVDLGLAAEQEKKR